MQGLTALRKLNLADNLAADLSPLTGLVILEDLNLSISEVTELGPLAGLPALVRLELTKTAVTELGPLASVPKLERLFIADTNIADLSPLTGLPIRFLIAPSCAITDLSPIASFPPPELIDLRDNTIVQVDALADVDWMAPRNTYAMLLLTGNPLSAKAMQLLPDMCDATGVSFEASDLQCITDACIPASGECAAALDLHLPLLGLAHVSRMSRHYRSSGSPMSRSCRLSASRRVPSPSTKASP